MLFGTNFIDDMIAEFEAAIQSDMEESPNMYIYKYLIEKLQTEAGVSRLDAVKIVARANINIPRKVFDHPRFNQLLVTFSKVVVKACKTLTKVLGYEEAIIVMSTRPLEFSFKE